LEKGVYIEAKPFSVGFRIEHRQSVIDQARFGRNAGNEILGAADYKLVHHCKNGRSVYSFCMCPGGTVVAATSEEKRVVTNGMSQYSRREAIPAFNRKIKGFAADDALLTGVETRTSAPINIKRDENLQSINTKGLFPGGEGAGYAGGIMSAAIDGIKIAEAMALSMKQSAGSGSFRFKYRWSGLPSACAASPLPVYTR